MNLKVNFQLLLICLLMEKPLQADPVQDAMDSVGAREWQELGRTLLSVTASCVDKIFTNQSDAVMGAKALVKDALGGIVQVLAEQGTTLAMKKDFPNACHVLTKEQLSEVEEGDVEKSVCIISAPRGGCTLREERKHPTFTYHWPKYFVEVSEKGNDPHPSFSAGNKLYAANRKLANSFAQFIDVKGPFALTAKVVGASEMISGATRIFSGHGLDLADSTGHSLSDAMKATSTIPLEKLRIRSSKKFATFDANIWPVGLSKTMAENLAICGDGNPQSDNGGFGWPIPGVAMTCPVAMSKDMWPYWDSGFLDYLNPIAVKSIATSVNPLSCAADNLTSVLFDKYGKQQFKESYGDSGKKKELNDRISNLSDPLQGLRYCSFPIMGDTEAIYRMYQQNIENLFSGPWCTLWGPLSPRSSSAVRINDYTYANTALKFKSLAHDVFGIPRGKQERWALAYPWENETGGLINDILSGLRDLIGANISPELAEKITKKFDLGVKGRSTLLVPPGDPRLIDIASDYATQAKNLVKQAAYLTAMNEAASEAERRTIEALRREHQVTGPTDYETMETQMSDELDEAHDATQLAGMEAIYREKSFCHAAADRKGVFVGQSGNRFSLPYDGYVQGGPYDFEEDDSLSNCHDHDVGHCLKRRWDGKCTKKRRGQLIFYRKQVKTGYRKVVRPRAFSVETKCQISFSETATRKREYVICTDHISSKRNPRSPLTKPSRNDPSTVFKDEEMIQAAGAAAKTAAWVGAEFARAKYEDILGKSLLPGKKRVYTIFEKVTCQSNYFRTKIGPVYRWENCKEGVQLEVKKFIQTRLLRKFCDKILGSPLGKPFK